MALGVWLPGLTRPRSHGGVGDRLHDTPLLPHTNHHQVRYHRPSAPTNSPGRVRNTSVQPISIVEDVRELSNKPRNSFARLQSMPFRNLPITSEVRLPSPLLWLLVLTQRIRDADQNFCHADQAQPPAGSAQLLSQLSRRRKHGLSSSRVLRPSCCT